MARGVCRGPCHGSGPHGHRVVLLIQAAPMPQVESQASTAKRTNWDGTKLSNCPLQYGNFTEAVMGYEILKRRGLIVVCDQQLVALELSVFDALEAADDDVPAETVALSSLRRRRAVDRAAQ